MEKYTIFMDQKNQYSEHEYTTQSNLQIQCNPYQATNGIFHRNRTNNFIICMEIQKTSNSQSNLEKEEWNQRNQPAWLYTTKLQSSRQYRTDTTTENPEINPCTYGHLIFDKGGKTIQWRKDNFFNKWCGKNFTATCKRMKLEHFLTPHKDKLKMD